MAGLRRSLAPGIAALALIAAACAGVDATILATVDGAEITVDDLRVMRPAYEGEFETNTERVRTDLTVLIISEAVLASAADLGVEITEAEIDQRIADPPPRYADALATTAADVELTEVVLRRDARMSLLRDKVSAELMRAEDGFLEGIIDEAPQEVAVGCIRHILVDTEQEALAALDRLGAGEDFAALADELSTDTVSIGGLLANASTCMLPMGRWVPEFASVAAVAPLNELVGPVQSDFGFHIIRVEDRIAPTRDEFIADPIPYVDGGTISSFFTPWFNGEVRAADISVNELVGRWSTDGVGIAPPDA